VAWAAAGLARQQQHDGCKQRPHTAEADQAHAAQPRAIRLSRELALDEVEIIADRREIGASLIGQDFREGRDGVGAHPGISRKRRRHLGDATHVVHVMIATGQ